MTTVTVPPRSEVPDQFKWDTTSIFPTQAAWDAEVEAIQKDFGQLDAFRGKITSPAILADAMDAIEGLVRRAGKVYMHAALHYYPENSNPIGVGMIGQAQGLFGQVMANIAFFDPELIAIGQPTLADWIKQESRLAHLPHYVDNLFRLQAHVRSAEVEEIMGMLGEPFGSLDTTVGIFTDSELPFPKATGKDGDTSDVSQGSIETLRFHPDREMRRTSYNNYHDSYLSYKNTLANAWLTSIKQGVFTSRVRGYGSTLEMALSNSNIPLTVYENLLNTYKANLPTWHKYWRVRRKALKLDVLRPYDTWAPLTDHHEHIPYDKSVEWICAGLEPLGADYVKVAREGMTTKRWVDIYPNQGKTGGAFSSGFPDTEPYILMSYDDTFQSLSTLAHELGHSMHSYLTRKHQPFLYADYTIFVAEVASNFNQAMVRDYLLKTNNDPYFQIQLIEEAMYNIHRYFFQMPTLARFEREIHSRVESGQGVTADDMIEVMADFFTEGYGSEMEIDRQRVGITWATFGHLYAHFYVYQYATGISAAHALANRILGGTPNAAEDYLGFLKSGSSKYPLDVLKAAGADLTTPQVVESAFQVLAGYVDRLESLVDQIS